MKLVLQIAGGIILAGLVVSVLGVACVALFAKGVSDSLDASVCRLEATSSARQLSVAETRVVAGEATVAAAAGSTFHASATGYARDLDAARTEVPRQASLNATRAACRN